MESTDVVSRQNITRLLIISWQMRWLQLLDVDPFASRAADKGAVQLTLSPVVQPALTLGEEEKLGGSLWLCRQQFSEEGATGDVDALATLIALLGRTAAKGDLCRVCK